MQRKMVKWKPFNTLLKYKDILDIERNRSLIDKPVIMEDRIIKIGGKEIAADPAEENIISIKTLLSNGFKKKSDGDYRKICKMR